jgi:hypothetical protein
MSRRKSRGRGRDVGFQKRNSGFVPPPQPLPLELQIPESCPEVNSFFTRNWEHLVLVGYRQWVIFELLRNKQSFEAACTSTEGTGLSAALICRAFSTTMGTISWPKLPGYQRFFQCSWPPPQQYEATVKPCCIDNALMLQVVQEYMQLSHKQLQVLKNQVSVEVDKQVRGNLNLRTERSYKEHGYLYSITHAIV